MKNPLTQEHRRLIQQACSDLDQAKGLCRKCSSCGIDTKEMEQVISELDAKARALNEHFFPSVGSQTELAS